MEHTGEWDIKFIFIKKGIDQERDKKQGNYTMSFMIVMTDKEESQERPWICWFCVDLTEARVIRRNQMPREIQI